MSAARFRGGAASLSLGALLGAVVLRGGAPLEEDPSDVRAFFLAADSRPSPEPDESPSSGALDLFVPTRLLLGGGEGLMLADAGHGDGAIQLEDGGSFVFFFAGVSPSSSFLCFFLTSEEAVDSGVGSSSSSSSLALFLPLVLLLLLMLAGETRGSDE